MPAQFPYSKRLIPLARELRKNMTPEERRLWYDYLSPYAAASFDRQRPIGDKYIVDFFSLAAKLVIEVDGGQHYEGSGPQKDAARDTFLTGLGLRVVRIMNTDIRTNFTGVCQYLDSVIKEQLALSASFPP